MDVKNNNPHHLNDRRTNKHVKANIFQCRTEFGNVKGNQRCNMIAHAKLELFQKTEDLQSSKE